MNLSPAQRQMLLNIARNTIRAELSGHAPAQLPDDPELAQPAGCFVTLHELGTHRLRGCVGRLDANAPVAQVVQLMAGAVLEDPRFIRQMPVTIHDLPNLEIELSVLTPLVPASDPLDFDLLEDGIYLTAQGRSGCFLPQVARETHWSKEQLLDRLCTEKMGLPARTWREPEAKLEKFRVLLIGPEPFVLPAGAEAPGHKGTQGGI